MYVWNILWCNDDTKKAPIQCRREGFGSLDAWWAFDQIYTCGIYFGVMTTPNKSNIHIEGRVLLPSMCGRFSTGDVPLVYTLEQ